MPPHNPQDPPVTKGAVVELSKVARRPPGGVVEDHKPGFVTNPHLITPIVWGILACIWATTAAALWQIIFAPSPYAYALATVCVLGNFLMLGIFFGKNGKAGSLTISK